MFESDTTTAVDTAAAEVEAYKDRVRERALMARDHMSWPTESLNKTLTTLGLPPHEECHVAVALKGTNTFTLTPQRRGGETPEQAIERVKAMSDAEVLTETAYHSWVIERGEPVVTIPGTDGEADPDASTTDLATYKKLVRRVALAAAKEREWCDDGTNEYLRALDLAPKVKHRVPVTVTTTHRVLVQVEDAESMEEARERVAAGDSAPVEAAVRDRLGVAATLVSHEPTVLGDIKVGDPDVTHPYASPTCDVRDRRRDPVTRDYSGTGHYCTWHRDHDGDHVAGNGTEVIAVWPQEPSTNN